MIFIKNNKLIIQNKDYWTNNLNVKDNKFAQLMKVYELAMQLVESKINLINEEYKKMFGEDLVNHVACRIKTPESILKKMKRKNFELTYKELIENIQDIAGVRIVCPFKGDIYEIIEIIRKLDDWKIIKEKDYITKPKASGYMSYHVILEVPVQFEGAELYAKVEVQIRSMAMDFWATLEHELQYKGSTKVSSRISKELLAYSKTICKIDNKLTKISKRKYNRNFELTK